MKRDEYKKIVLKKLDKNKEITCEDCGEKDIIGHAIVDHVSNKMKMVCDRCFREKYRDFLYSNEMKRGIN